MASRLTKPHTTGSSRANKRRASERPWTCEMRSLRSAAAGNARERRPTERRKTPTPGRLSASDSTTVATAFASGYAVATTTPVGASAVQDGDGKRGSKPCRRLGYRFLRRSPRKSALNSSRIHRALLQCTHQTRIRAWVKSWQSGEESKSWMQEVSLCHRRYRFSCSSGSCESLIRLAYVP